MSFILRFWPYLAGAALLIVGAWRIHHAGYESGYAAAEVQWQARFAEAERARDAANRAALQKEADSNALTLKAEAEHAKSVASLNLRAADADKRLRALGVRLATGSSRRCEVPEAAGTSSEPDATAASIARADGAGASIGDTGRRCELDAAAKVEWQRFYTELRSIINR